MNVCINGIGSSRFVSKFIRNGTVGNAPKYEFGVQWGGSVAFIANNGDTTSLHKLVHLLHQFSPFCTDFRGLTKQSETPQNLSLGSNRVDPVHLI
jgi:hypothetical protein